jgi:hypothetical protein
MPARIRLGAGQKSIDSVRITTIGVEMSTVEMSTIVELEIPFDHREFQSAHLSLRTPENLELMEISAYKSDDINDPTPFYVASWQSRHPLGTHFLMMQLLHQEEAERVGLSKMQLSYTWNAPGDFQADQKFHELDSRSVEQFLVEVVKQRIPPEFVRVDGMFFGLSLERATEPQTVSFASFFRLPSAVAAMWAASGPAVGGELEQRYVQNLVAEATSDFSNWTRKLHEKLHGQP